MKKVSMKFISLVLVTAIIVTCCVIAAVSASAAAGGVVYFDNSVTNFSTPYVYTWGDGGNGNWPGKAMTNVTGNIWAYSLTNGDSNIIFSNNGSNQSADLTIPSDKNLATPTGSGDKFQVNWSNYSGDVTLPTQETQATQATQGSTSSGGGAGTIYCQNDANWSTVYCYMWNSESDKNSAWPGVKMTDLGEGIWEYNYSKSFKNVIFSQNASPQTSDLVVPTDGKNCYNNKTNTWDVFSNSPVKITAFTSSLASPSYTDCSITLAATAKSSEGGALTYKFSANSSVLYQGSSASVVWIPTSAGNYKLTVEVSDGVNTNSRSMNFEIKSSQGLVEAYIRGFTNSLGTRYQIKRNSAITFTNDAIGGQTGNYKLFYKFQITDPNGNNNVAYYTTGKTYTYTPTTLGTYTVKAFVQNSYNSTVTNTYTYTCVDNIDESGETPPTQSTQPTQATQASSETQSTQATQTQATDPSQPTQLKGDADGNGKVDINDVTAIQFYLVDIPYYKANLNTTLADVTGDGKVKIQDANKIQQYLARIITTL